MKRASLMILAAAALLLSGCIYVHTVEPLTTDMHATPMSSYEKKGTLQLITFPPFAGSYRLVAWGNAAIGEVAKKEGMSEIYFADVETFSILRVWNQYTVHVYGK
ncbi:MAG: hypothetical protein M0042_10000 [Nitrospiraceae bacterium]|nr:hypothetical protein [Nitrospiraceae bacterium]